MEEKDLVFENFRKELIDIHMKLALLRSKEGNPLYEQEIAQAKAQLANVKRNLAKYKSKKKEEMKR